MLIKFITLNLFVGGRLFNNVKEFLQEEKPDIIAFQEIFNGNDAGYPENMRSIQVLKKVLPGYDYAFSPFLLAHLDIGNIESGNAVFSRYPILDSKTIFFDVPYNPDYRVEDFKGDYSLATKAVQSAQINLGSSVLNILNNHGIWGFNGFDNPRRLKMSEIIVEQIKNKDKIILAGDFNLNYHTQTVANIEKYLESVFKDELKTTFNMKHKTDPGYAKAAVDMVFVSKNIKVLKKYCPQVDVSDHLPLVVILDI